MVLASNNPGKIREINALLAAQTVKVLPQEEFGVPEVEETGLSFVENALIKARNASLHTGLPALADDSGIEVDALGGEPGIYSARYAGVGATDEANLLKLLEDMAEVPEAKRQARFQCILVYMKHAKDPTPIICQGTWEGRLLTKSAGKHGFGYDPIFWVPTHHCASAELDPEVKNQLSHRRQALDKFVTAFSAIKG
ncbi:nucleoside-triphosphate diphosphatase [Achromatium sp. WMS2]|nr:nucleoside-triphosphate diphosphatase [Achromatium sp. WMS2]